MAMNSPAIRPFALGVEQLAIDDLHARLDRVRWPDEAPAEQGAPWAFGTSLAFMRELVHHWRHRFDWRRTEAALNAWPQFKTRIDGIDLHFLHVPGKGPGAAKRALLLSHGWPGSVLEFLELIARLTDPRPTAATSATPSRSWCPRCPATRSRSPSTSRARGWPRSVPCSTP